MSEGYEALRSGAALLDLSRRGRIYATGEDRARLLHALTTNHIQQLRPGQGTYAFFLTAQGRVLADAHILCFEDRLLLDVEPETRVALFQHIDHYIIADDVMLEDASEVTFAIGLEGPRARAVLQALDAPAPSELEAHAAWGPHTIARIAFTGGEGYRIFGARAEQAQLTSRFLAAGAIGATLEDARSVRIEHGLPRYGEDISGSTLPQETGIARALHFSKGCYIGQEIVERIRSRGHVNKALAAIVIDAPQPFEAGTKVMAAGVAAGEITSSAWSPANGNVAAIAMLRVQSAAAGAALEVAGFTARVREAS